jgi:hypothetical protein
MVTIDVVAMKFSEDVIRHIKKMMSEQFTRDIDFHEFRMNLLCAFSDIASTTDKLHALADEVNSVSRFDLIEVTSDRAMGESIARYIFSKLMVALNEEWLKILDHELDRTKSEIISIREKQTGFKEKIGRH